MNIFSRDKDNFYTNEFINKLLVSLLFISVIVIPFDDLPYFQVLGGLGRRASTYGFLIMVPLTILIFLRFRKIFYTNCIENNLIFAFYISCIVGIIINFNRISDSLFKGQSGIKRAIIQMGSVSLLILAMYIIQFILNKNNISIKTIRKFICLSFVPVAILGILQLINLLRFHDFTNILENLSYFINASLRGSSYPSRLRGVSAEASYLGMYCSFIFPWFFSYILTEKKIRNKVFHGAVCILILSLVVGTKSRTATLLTIISIVCLAFLFLLFYRNNKTKLLSSVVLILMGIFLFGFSNSLETIVNRPISSESQDEGSKPPVLNESVVNNYEVGQLISSINDPNIISNISRSSMQKAAFKMGMNNPILGVGIGQFGFYLNDYLTDDAYYSHEVQEWADTNNPIWPPVHSIYHRIFAENGLIGLLIYFAFIVSLCLKLFIKIIKNKKDFFGIILLSSYGVILIGGLTLDQYVIPQFWIMSALVVAYNNNLIKTPEI